MQQNTLSRIGKYRQKRNVPPFQHPCPAQNITCHTDLMSGFTVAIVTTIPALVP